MSKRADVAYRRKWIQSYVDRYKPVTVSEVAEKASALAIPSLPAELGKTYWIIAKDIQKLRRSGDIPQNAVVFKKLAGRMD